MGKYKLTHKAKNDLSQIWEYTLDNWSESQADYYYDLLIRNCQSIALSPESGKNYYGVKPDLFGLPVGRHIIFYRESFNGEVEIIRILHEEMDISNRIEEK